MIIKNWTHQNANKKGILKSGGSVKIEKGISTSLTCSCTINNCKCNKEFWLSINFGYNTKDKTVSGITFYFKDI